MSNIELEVGLKAGNYKPGLTGVIKSLVFPGSSTASTQHLVNSHPKLVDISFYQVSADFYKMMDNGVRGAIIRAGQNTWPDNKAVEFMSNATASGIPFGSYWFYDSRSDPKDQAKLWSEVLSNFDTRLMCWADYEESYGGAYGGWRKFYDFLEWCKFYMPSRKLGIYTGYYYWLEHSPNPITQAANLEYFNRYPLWLAWYADYSVVRVPKPWTEMLLWQYTDNGDGRLLGVSSLNIDMNEFIGTQEEYEKFFNLDGNNGGSTMQVIRGTAVGNVRLRRTPAGATFSPERYLYTGNTIEADRNEAQWLHITKINNVPTTEETWASAGTNQQYIRWDWVNVPDPDPEPEPTDEYILYVKDGVTRKFIPE